MACERRARIMNTLKWLYVVLGCTFAVGCGGRTNTEQASSMGGASTTAGSGIGGNGFGATGGGNAESTGTTGGAKSSGADAGSGCTGNFETIQTGGSGLCVAKMVTIQGPASNVGSADYQIDVTEVTQGQYSQWLATNPALPASTDANCGNMSTGGSYKPAATGYTGTDSDHHPVTYVNWCDAYAYCAGVGERLCGAIGGGSNDYASNRDATLSQWYRACTSGDKYAYAYGDNYQSSYCNGQYFGAGTTTLVASLPNCVTSSPGYAGVYDLSGNVAEWEDSCDGTTGEDDQCHLRGGSFVYGSDIVDTDDLNCAGAYSNGYRRGYALRAFGIRCCSD